MSDAISVGDRVRSKYLEKPTGTVIRLYPENHYNLLVQMDEEFHYLVPSGEPPVHNWAEKDVEAL